MSVAPEVIQKIEEYPATWENIVQVRNILKEMLIEYWINENLFTFNWWFLIIVTIGAIAIWVIVVDKKRILEIITFGLLVSSTAFVLDVIGTSFELWSYPYRIMPNAPPIIEIHKAHMPIIYMIIYQYFTKWKAFFIAITIISLIFAFVLEPLLVWLGNYEVYRWEYIYSFPIYILIGVMYKWLVIKLKQMDGHY